MSLGHSGVPLSLKQGLLLKLFKSTTQEDKRIEASSKCQRCRL